MPDTKPDWTVVAQHRNIRMVQFRTTHCKPDTGRGAEQALVPFADDQGLVLVGTEKLLITVAYR
jgi:hypothetical protein